MKKLTLICTLLLISLIAVGCSNDATNSSTQTPETDNAPTSIQSEGGVTREVHTAPGGSGGGQTIIRESDQGGSSQGSNSQSIVETDDD